METKSVEQIMQERNAALANNIAGVVEPLNTTSINRLADELANDYFSKGVAAQEGEERQWGGKTYQKINGQWKPVVGEKSKKDEKKPAGQSARPQDAHQGQGNEIQIDKHEIAQLTHMKQILDSDPAKAYEIFLSLTPEAQHKVPQDVIDKMVESSHSGDNNEIDYNGLGEQNNKDKPKPSEGKTPVAKTLIKEGFSSEDANAIGNAANGAIAAAVKAAGIPGDMVKTVGDLLNLKPDLLKKIIKNLNEKETKATLSEKITNKK